jgi:hypothetical protein
MKRVIAMTAILLLAAARVAPAQTAQTSMSGKPLADVAKDEEARRNAVKKPAKVYTNSDLKPDFSKAVPTPPSATTGGATTDAGTSNASPSAPDAGKGEAKDQAYWQKRIAAARAQADRSQLFADSLQTRINSLLTDFINMDDPAQKAKLEADRIKALGELDKVKKEVEDQKKAITDIEEEARRAGVPPSWLRSGA